MTLALARFLFGFSLALACTAIFLAVSMVCLYFVRRAVRTLPDERHQDLVSAAAVLLCVVVALLGCYASGHALHAWLGRGIAMGQPNWLAGNSHVSAAALMGATVALGLAAAMPGLWRRLREPQAKAETPAVSSKASAKLAKVEKTAKAEKAARRAGGRAPRIAALGWGALFLILLGGVLLAFAYIVAPPGPASLAAGADAKAIARADLHAEHASRARPVYYAGAGLLGAGGLMLLAWVVLRRREQA
ncbi:hypothetical protein ACLQ9F_14370 [Bordetella avium]|uniref:hypothetical protein n=3 Tax=Bordetella avium TaxID=521 RepID=UPI000E0C1415|nr:hypothetical protein [Bordetella avium]AZY49219.1 hypothetical protein C0J09_08745 [Bordetella avium]RIQ12699.1 hypothetical protein D0432_11480 [Bordetella avium]RIQ19263.1 hypothetical protein D0850_04155 [Bordetella avium]RIQ33431.1 hypothetical protein D0849_10845 [Bordetella avium]RIQ37871.1 hypothetical protein D0848_09345 [Bordetella avium]